MRIFTSTKLDVTVLPTQKTFENPAPVANVTTCLVRQKQVIFFLTFHEYYLLSHKSLFSWIMVPCDLISSIFKSHNAVFNAQSNLLPDMIVRCQLV